MLDIALLLGGGDDDAGGDGDGDGVKVQIAYKVMSLDTPGA